MTSQPVASYQTATLLVYSDAEALPTLASAQFQSGWKALAAKCPWATALQAPQFARAWYECYRERYRPLILVHYGAGGEMDGLMALAVERASGRLTFAGGHQAEYNVWLALPGEQTFVVECLERLRQLKFSSLSFTYLPPGTPLEWLKAGWDRKSTISTVQRPLLTVDNADAVRESLAKKKNRRRLEKLQESGSMAFLELSTPGELDACYDDIIDFYDFRMGAVHGTCPFRDDSRKRDFYRSLMAEGLLHVTITKVGQSLVASHIGLRNKNTVMLGIVGHSPFQAIHSPGKLHILQLGLLLHQEGFASLDLTPGGDSYKEDRATTNDEAYDLTVFLDSKALFGHRIATILRSIAKSTARILHLNSGKLSSLRSFAQNPIHSLPAWAGALRRWIWSSSELCFYRAAAGSSGSSNDFGMQRDRVRDLLSYEPADPQSRSKQEFLSHALAAVEAGGHVYSIAKDNVLVMYARLAAPARKASTTDLQPNYEYPANSVVVCDFYTHPSCRGTELGSQSLREIVADVARGGGAEFVYIAAPAKDRATRLAVTGAGFQYQDSVIRNTRFGVTSTKIVSRAG